MSGWHFDNGAPDAFRAARFGVARDLGKQVVQRREVGRMEVTAVDVLLESSQRYGGFSACRDRGKRFLRC